MSCLYKYVERLSPLLIFDPLAVWDPTGTGEQVSGWFVPQLELTVCVHTGLPVLTLTRGPPGLTEGRPVVGDLLCSVLVELGQTVGEGAGHSSITVTSIAVALTEHHLDWAGPGLRGRGQRGRQQAGQLVQTVGGAAVEPAAVPGLKPHRAQVSLLGRLDGGRPHSPRLLPPPLTELEVILADGSQLRLT